MVEVSILVPTAGRPGPLERCLSALEAEVLEGFLDAEVLTIHAPGDEPSMEMVRERFPGVRVLQAPVRNLALQRNLGAAEARGEILVYIDDDAWPAPGWLDALVEPLADPGVAGASGPVLFPDGRLQFGPMAVTRVGRQFPLESPEEIPPGACPLLAGGNLALRRKDLLEAGGFDENYRYHLDDADLCVRLRARGRKLVYAEKARLFHEPARGPHRRGPWERDWFTVTANSVYFALRHGGAAGLLAPAALLAPKTLRLLVWALKGRLGPAALARCLAGQWAGLPAGYLKGLFRSPHLPFLEGSRA